MHENDLKSYFKLFYFVLRIYCILIRRAISSDMKDSGFPHGNGRFENLYLLKEKEMIKVLGCRKR